MVLDFALFKGVIPKLNFLFFVINHFDWPIAKHKKKIFEKFEIKTSNKRWSAYLLADLL